MKRNDGITLVALVITIIILLILAGITLGFVFGKNGIINIAQEAGKNYQEAARKEEEELNSLYSSMIVATNDNATITITTKELNELISSKVVEEVEKNTNDLRTRLENVEASQQIKSGVVTSGSIVANGKPTFTVDFNTPFESDQYAVTFGMTGGGNYWNCIQCTILNKTANGFVFLVQNSGTGTSASFPISWIAVPYNS